MNGPFDSGVSMAQSRAQRRLDAVGLAIGLHRPSLETASGATGRSMVLETAKAIIELVEKA